jgi:hypothetical protein
MVLDFDLEFVFYFTYFSPACSVEYVTIVIIDSCHLSYLGI